MGTVVAAAEWALALSVMLVPGQHLFFVRSGTDLDQLVLVGRGVRRRERATIQQRQGEKEGQEQGPC
jgi:hypothetical protein